MTDARDDMREQLLAALQAAPELAREDRAHLADVFLDNLNRRYRLVPRRGAIRDGLANGWDMLASGHGPVSLALLLIGAIFLLPLLIVPLFILAHVPFLFLFLVVFLVLRLAGFGRRRRYFPPRGGWV
ncbi:MAG TPA: hypothetical protein VFA78_03570 [Chloroflexota bacterium]|nr:hypothetical protein [Chloroflexota bacterium]